MNFKYNPIADRWTVEYQKTSVDFKSNVQLTAFSN